MGHPLILVIEDDETIALSLRVFFEKRGCEVLVSHTGEEGLKTAFKELPCTVLLDMRLPDKYGFEILEALKKECPEISVIVMTGYAEIEEAVKAMKLGAEYYFRKPIDMDELSVIVDKSMEIRRLRQEVALYQRIPFPIIGRSKHIQGLIHMINLLASNPSATVLIRGETGTGKELVARNIHSMSSRGAKPFIALNCAAIPENILESELFGYEAGAFTDARKTKQGMFELASEGTLFLDEIGDMSPSAQAKILRVLEDRTLRRLGGTRDIEVDVRIIAATNKNIDELLRNGSFREDLYYRLNVMPLFVAPLRERPEDIPLIAAFILEEIKGSLGKRVISGFTEKSLHSLSTYGWPGNVRELKNVIERAAILCTEQYISVHHLNLPEEIMKDDMALTMTLSEMEQTHIKHVLQTAGGNKTKTALILGIARSTLNEKLKLYNIQ